MRSHYYKNTIISNNKDSSQYKDPNTKYILQNDYELTDISVIKELIFDPNQILSKSECMLLLNYLCTS